MKKIVSLFPTIFLFLSVASCGGEHNLADSSSLPSSSGAGASSLVPSGSESKEDERLVIYQLAKAEGYQGSYEEFLASICGADGTPFLHGWEVPAGIGKDGDTYLDLTTWDAYVKTAGGWSKIGNIMESQGLQIENGVVVRCSGGGSRVLIPTFWGGVPVVSIGDSAFSDCSSLVSITIPSSVTSIGRWAFSRCASLSSLAIPEGVTSIGQDAFVGCSSLGSISVDPANPAYDSRGGCNAIIETATGALVAGCSSTVIPEGVTSIGPQAFYGCSSLTSLTIPEGVQWIGYGAFWNCSSLASATIPSSVTSIGDHAFAGCPSLESISVDPANYGYDSRGGCNAIIQTATGALVAGCSSTVIPEGVTSINRYAFQGCSSLTSITIPSSVTSIGEYAFSGCSSLESVVIPSTVASIGDDAFLGCASLTSVVIPEGVASIGEFAFYRCSSLVSVTIPSTVASIGEYAFYECASLTSVVIPEGVASIGVCSFYGCASLTSVVIPEGVASIGYFAFHGCSSLTSIVIPSTVTFIDCDCFADCNPSLIIYCKVSEQPAGWNSCWNRIEWNKNYPVMWGYVGD